MQEKMKLFWNMMEILTFRELLNKWNIEFRIYLRFSNHEKL